MESAEKNEIMNVMKSARLWNLFRKQSILSS